jgi:putative peptidoglycan lipid II flippase
MHYAVISLTANTLGSIALFLLFRSYGLMPHLGIAVATTLGGWLNAGLLFTTLVRRGHFIADVRLRRALPLIVFSSATMGVFLWFVSNGLGTTFGAATPSLERFAALCALVASGLAVYALALFVTGALDMRELRGFLRRRVPPGPV